MESFKYSYCERVVAVEILPRVAIKILISRLHRVVVKLCVVINEIIGEILLQ